MKICLGFKIVQLCYNESILFLTLIVSNVEVPQLIDIPVLVGCDNPEPIPHIVLLQVLLRQVLQVPLGEGTLRSDADLVFLAGDGDSATEDPSLSIDLDAVVEELLEGGNVHNLIFHGLAAVDGEGLGLLLALGPGRGLLGGNCDRHCCGGCGASDEEK